MRKITLAILLTSSFLMANENGLDEGDLVIQAKKQFEDDKEKLRSNSSDDFDKLFGIVNQRE